MKTFFVVNPMSANGVTGKRWAETQARVHRAIGENFGFAFTEGPMHAAHLARKALHDGAEVVVAVGGDGTINETVNGFFEKGQAINPQAALAVVPRGTGGDFRRTFGWSLELDPALERLRGAKQQPFDVGLLEFTSADGHSHQRYFANITSFGVSGLVDQEANTSTKAFGGRISFMLASMKALLKYKDQRVRVRLDGGPWEEVSVTTMAVANGQYFGGGMKIAPGADTGDGMLEVTLWTGYGLSDFVLKQKGIYAGDHAKWSGTRMMRCKVLEAESLDEVLIDCDGEQPGRLPCRISVLPSAIRLVV